MIGEFYFTVHRSPFTVHSNKERKVAYITTAERIGMKKGIEIGIQQGIQQGLLKAIELGLKLKFGVEGLRIYPEIKKIKDVDVLEAISEAIESAGSVEEIRRIYK